MHICRSHQPTLRPKPAKELAYPNALTERQCSKNERIMTRKINNETPTSCIKHLADSANFKVVASNKLCSGLTGNRFEMPNVSYINR